MPRIRVIYDKHGDRLAEWQDGELVYATEDYLDPPTETHFVMPDIPDYTSPVDGRLISGRAQRREDMKRSGSRPWEGLEAERKEAARKQRYLDERMDRHAYESAARALHQISYRSRRILEGR